MVSISITLKNVLVIRVASLNPSVSSTEAKLSLSLKKNKQKKNVQYAVCLLLINEVSYRLNSVNSE